MRMLSFFSFKEQERKRRIEEANERFNIRRVGDRDVIVYGGVVISRSTDTDLLERLQELREMYINK